MAEIPIFPLKTVLLPGNTLALKIFEPRYVDMIAKCMREGGVFGVVLIHKGEETAIDADIYSVGTTATISDWENRADGLLSITTLGVDRFEIITTRTQDDGLTFAETKVLEESNTQDTPEQFFYMVELLDHLGAQTGRKADPKQAFSELLYQLVYQLPLETKLKQRLLEIPDCTDRAVILHAELIRLGVIQYVKPEASGQ